MPPRLRWRGPFRGPSLQIALFQLIRILVLLLAATWSYTMPGAYPEGSRIRMGGRTRRPTRVLRTAAPTAERGGLKRAISLPERRGRESPDI